GNLARLVRLDVRPQPVRSARDLQAALDVALDQLLVKKQARTEDRRGVRNRVFRIHDRPWPLPLPCLTAFAHYTLLLPARNRPILKPARPMRTIAEFLRQLPTTPDQGLDPHAVAATAVRMGVNRLTPLPREPVWRKFLEKFDEPIIKILL